MKCPGQDRGYWSGDRVFDLPCPKCGATVEFFRDEATRRCTRCGYAFPNARIALDCASWCDQAEACLGISRSGGKVRADAETALSGKLIRALEEELGAESDTYVRSLLVFQHAKELVQAVGVDPRVVLPAALLLEAVICAAAGGGESACGPKEGSDPSAIVQRVLARAGLEPDVIQATCDLLTSFRQGDNDAPSLAVLSDARRLAQLTAERTAASSQQPAAQLAEDLLAEFRTEAGAARAKGLFQH